MQTVKLFSEAVEEVEYITEAKEDGGKSKKVAETEGDLLHFWQTVKARLSAENIKYFDNVIVNVPDPQ